MNKAKARLLRYLREQGYVGNGSLESVKAFIEDNELDIRGAEGKALDVEAVITGKAVKYRKNKEGGGQVVIDVDEDDDEDGAKAEDNEEDDEESDSKSLRPSDIRALVKALNGQKPDNGNGLDVRVTREPEDDETFGYGPSAKGGSYKFFHDVIVAGARAKQGQPTPERLTKAVGLAERREKALSGSVRGKAGAGVNEAIDSEGGFLVPPQFSSELLKKVHETGAIVSRARSMPMGSSQLVIPTINETSRADGSRAGGVRGYWTSEGGSLTGSQPKFGQVTLNANKLTVLTYLTSEVIEDSAVSIEPLVSELMVEETRFKLENAFINGTGAGQPLGLLNAPATVSVSKETNQTATTIVFENVIKMWARMFARSRATAVWFINQNVEPQLLQMYVGTGTAGQPVYMPPGGISGAPYGTLFGRPVIPVEYCASLGTVGDIILADMQAYLYGQRRNERLETSMHVRFTTDEQAIRLTLRADGQPWWNAPLTPFKGTSDTQSPFVTLATRS